MTSHALELERIVKEYPIAGGALPILRGVSFAVPQGQSMAIMGPSGSGKSTLLSIIGCLEAPSSGTLRVLGQDVSRLDDDSLSSLRGAALGFVFQSFHLLPAYDALSNVALGALYSGTRDAAARARQLLAQVGLSHRLRHRPASLSGGERQRVAIARALINDPKIILADEPTGALDQRSGAEVLGILDTLHAQGKTVIVVTHDPGVARRAQRVLEVVDGQIVRERRGAEMGAA